eukprot:6026051-Lingulodinium_polyedra.AAC.1
MAMNWRPPRNFNLNYDWWPAPKKRQPATPEATPGNHTHSGTVVHYDSKPVAFQQWLKSSEGA